jgi:hypothetical protein
LILKVVPKKAKACNSDMWIFKCWVSNWDTQCTMYFPIFDMTTLFRCWDTQCNIFSFFSSFWSILPSRTTRCQFHQHFMRSFFVWKLYVQIFCTWSMALYFFGKRKLVEKLFLKMLVKLTTDHSWVKREFAERNKKIRWQKFHLRVDASIGPWGIYFTIANVAELFYYFVIIQSVLHNNNDCHFDVLNNTGGPRYPRFFYLRIRLLTYETLV